MKFYFAPLEGVSGYIYRNAYHKHFVGFDRYFTPFIAPKKNQALSSKELRDVLLENNQGMTLIPQILTNQVDYFLATSQKLYDLGYREVNLNLGCPSGTVVTKKKGAGFLAELDRLEHFLTEVTEELSKMGMALSIKTRIGLQETAEFTEIIELYNEYSLAELIVHPRLQKEQYTGKPHWEIFAQAVEQSKNSLCYNGDIFTVEDYQRFCLDFPQIEKVMLGRGVLRNPNLLAEIKGEKLADFNRLKQFHDDIFQGYQRDFSGEKPVIFKMRELWGYLLPLIPEGSQYAKKIHKADRIKEYEQIVEQIFSVQ